MITCIDCVNDNSKSIITSCAEKFFTESANPDIREFPDEENQNREIFIRGNYLSLKDIETAKQFDVIKLSTASGYEAIERLYAKLHEVYPTE